MKKLNFILTAKLSALVMLLWFPCCTYDKTTPKPVDENCETVNVGFTANVQPILSKNCFACHATRNAKEFGGSIDLENFEELKTYTEPVIRSIKQDDLLNYKAMPPRGKLDKCDIAVIDEWIKKGAIR